MHVTKPYEFIGFGAMHVTKPYEFIGFGAMHVTKPYESIGLGAMVMRPRCSGLDEASRTVLAKGSRCGCLAKWFFGGLGHPTKTL